MSAGLIGSDCQGKFGLYYTVGAGFPGGSVDKESACNSGDAGLIAGSGRFLEEGMATHCSILPWRIPWTEEPAGYRP